MAQLAVPRQYGWPSGTHSSPISSDPIDHETDAVAAVVTLYGIADWNGMPSSTVVSEGHLLGPGVPVDTQTLAATSPVVHVTTHEPPFFFVHGDRDQSVPIEQSIGLEAALRQRGDVAELITIPGGPHATGSWHTLPNVPN